MKPESDCAVPTGKILPAELRDQENRTLATGTVRLTERRVEQTGLRTGAFYPREGHRLDESAGSAKTLVLLGLQQSIEVCQVERCLDPSQDHFHFGW